MKHDLQFGGHKPSAIIPYIQNHLQLHPSMTPRDLVKLCYQAAHGAEHLLADPERARGYLRREMDSVEADRNIPLIEPISDGIARVNLAAWKARGLSVDRLFEMFLATAQVSGEGDARLNAYLDEVTEYLSRVSTTVPLSAWLEFIDEYNSLGRPAVHHSEAYRTAEHPAYRIVRRALLDGL